MTLRTLMISAAVVAWATVMLALSSTSALPLAQPAGSDSKVTVERVPDGGIQPQVAVGAQGGVRLVYFKGDAASGDIFYTELNPGAASFSKAVRVNSQSGSAIATGNMRGAHLALGKGGRVHVSWFGSERAKPRSPAGGTPMLYTRSNAARSAFDPQRNVEQIAVGLDGGAIAADDMGNVYVAWHAGGPESKSEGDRRLWVSRSTDEGAIFAREQPASNDATGACGCCGVGALADQKRTLYLMFRSARDVVHRDAYLLTSKNAGTSFDETKLQEWNIGACPMSTFALAEVRGGVLAAWETGAQVQFVRVDSESGTRSAITVAPGSNRTRKHPSIAGDAQGNVILAWTEDMGWGKGGAVLWQVFDKDGRPTAAHSRRDGVPVWSLVAAYSRPDSGFTILY